MWTFDGPFATCLADIEDTLRRAIVQVRRRRVDRRADRTLAARAQAARRCRRGDPAGVGRIPASGCRSVTGCRRHRGCAHCSQGRSAPGHRVPKLARSRIGQRRIMKLEGLDAEQGERNGRRERASSRITPTARDARADRRPARAEHARVRRAARTPCADDAEHLGPYAPLIGAIREELEHFVDQPASAASRDRRARPLRARVDRGRVR